MEGILRWGEGGFDAMQADNPELAKGKLRWRRQSHELGRNDAMNGGAA